MPFKEVCSPWFLQCGYGIMTDQSPKNSKEFVRICTRHVGAAESSPRDVGIQRSHPGAVVGADTARFSCHRAGSQSQRLANQARHESPYYHHGSPPKHEEISPQWTYES